MDFEIIDFHTHPFFNDDQNICSHRECFEMSAEQTKRDMLSIGITKICGSVLLKFRKQVITSWAQIKQANDDALTLRDMYGDFYVPGFHIHPDFVKDSCEEIERMEELGVRMIGELCPYGHNWDTYDSENLDIILDCAQQHNMLVSFHSMDEDGMDRMVEKHPDTVFVAAHPGEYGAFMRHMERMKKSSNYYLDLSGYGIFRCGMLRHAIDLFGAEKFVFGSDYPTCSPAMYVGGVLLDPLIKDEEKKLIFADNAKRLLGL